MNAFKVELRPLAEIKPYEKNPRLNDDAVAAVMNSIQAFGWRQPIVVDGDGVIICGHTRWKAAQRLGLEKVPVHVATDLSPEKVRAYRIADNKSGELAEWNMDLLPLEMTALQGAGIDWSSLGFSADDLAKIFDPGVQEGLTDPDAIPEPPDEPITKRGELWILGEHRLLCGDSASAADVDRLLDGQPIHLVNTDPPYNVKVEPRSNNAIAAGVTSFARRADLQCDRSTTERGKQDRERKAKRLHHQSFDVARQGEKKRTTRKMRAKDRPLENDFVSEEAFEEMLDAWFGNLARVLIPGGGFYIWGGYANLGNYPPALANAGLYFSQGIVWDKQHPVLTRKDFMGAFELCQPPGTQVLTPSGSVTIESLLDWDRVIGVDVSSTRFIQPRQGVEVARATRAYDGNLYGVVADDRTTWCTDGHLWSVRLVPNADRLWGVYLMRRGNWWRIGKAKILTTWGLGVKQRLAKEDADEAWILSVHRTNSEAMMREQVCSVRYGIPTTYWTQGFGEARSLTRSPEAVAEMYAQLDLDAMREGAMQALADHHRCERFPFVERGNRRNKYGRRVNLTIRTCNLLPGAMVVPLKLRRMRVEWRPLRAVDVQRYNGCVHSLGVPNGQHYLADGIVTHNCFYGWREGAAHRFFGPNNVADLWHVKKVNPASMVHLTEKPVELAVRAMQYSSHAGENVLDLFGGSGSSLIAAEQTGRHAYLMEIDPAYCDVIVQRYEQFTGKKAQRLAARAGGASSGDEPGRAS